MRSSAATVAESSLLLWALSAIVVMLATSVCLGWVRQAQINPRLRDNWLASLIAAAALGTGICGSIVLALSAEAMPFPLGYRMRDVPLLWVGAIAGCFPVMAWLGSGTRWYAVILSGIWLGALTLGVQIGWINAIGFRPGLQWRDAFLVAAAVLMVLGMTVGLWLAFSEASRQGQRRVLWRVGSALLLGLTVIAAQEVLLSGTNLLAQVGSVYRREVPAPLLCLVLGVLVPLVYAMMLFDLRMLRNHQRRSKRREVRNRRLETGQTETGAAPLTESGVAGPHSISSGNAVHTVSGTLAAGIQKASTAGTATTRV